MDGLLLDTETVYTIVTQEILNKFNKTFSWELKSQMMGMKQQDAAELLIKTLDIPMTPLEYLTERNAGHESKFPFCKPLPGVLKLIKHLNSCKIPIAVATSSHRNAFLLKSKNNSELFDLFNGNITCGDDHVEMKGKPHPDIFQTAASKLCSNYDPREFLVFEDAPSGVLAALNAGMNVIWVPDVNLSVDKDLAERCLKVLYSIEEFNPQEFGIEAYKTE